MPKDKVILHCDLNNFFASVEMRLDPTLRGKPLAVCGDPEERKGIVLAKCEVAKKHGVRTGDTVWMAKQKCPDINIVVPRHDQYSKHSRLVRDIYARYTDKVESFGIDEYWLDVTHSAKLFGDGTKIANEIRQVIKKELELTISVGVSWNKTYAKLGSDFKKPDATTTISRKNYQDIIYTLPVDHMLFVGRKMRAMFEKLNIRTIGDLAEYDEKLLSARIGISATKLIRAARGEDDDDVADHTFKREIKSVGNGTTAPNDLTTVKEVEKLVYILSEEVAYRMRKKGVKGRTINVSVRDDNLKWRGAQASITHLTNSATTISEMAMTIFTSLVALDYTTKNDGFSDICYDLLSYAVRSIRVSVSNLVSSTGTQQLSFLDNVEEKNDKLSKAFDKIRGKHGTSKVSYGTALESMLELDFEVLDDTD